MVSAVDFGGAVASFPSRQNRRAEDGTAGVSEMGVDEIRV